MAVVEVYSNPFLNSQGVPNKLQQNLQSTGAFGGYFLILTTVAASDNNNSIYRIIKEIPADLVPLWISVGNTANTGGNSYDLGIWRTKIGSAVLAQTVFAAALDMSVAAASINPKTGKDGGAGLTIAGGNLGKRIFELAGHTIETKLPSYDIAYKANTVGTTGCSIVTMLAYGLA